MKKQIFIVGLVMLLIFASACSASVNKVIEKKLEEINVLISEKKYSIAYDEVNELNNNTNDNNSRKQEIMNLLVEVKKLLDEQNYEKGEKELENNELLAAKSYFSKIKRNSDLYLAAQEKICFIDNCLGKEYLCEAKEKYEANALKDAVNILKKALELSSSSELNKEIGELIYKLDSEELKVILSNKVLQKSKEAYKNGNYNQAFNNLKEAISYGNKEAEKLLPVYKKAKEKEDQEKEKEEQEIANKQDISRRSFANWLKNGLYPMCKDAYFNSQDELIIIIDNEWYYLAKEEKKDVINVIEDKLKQSKIQLGVEGFGQFFSVSGEPLESFYAY